MRCLAILFWIAFSIAFLIVVVPIVLIIVTIAEFLRFIGEKLSLIEKI